MKAMLAVVPIALSLTGCAHDFAEVKSSQLNQAFMINSSPTFLGYDYVGSDASYHYFAAKWKYGTDRRFKVSSSDMVVNKAMPVGNAAVEVLPYGPTTPESEEFGKIGAKTLFRKE